MFRNSLDHHVLKFLFVFFMYFICQKEKSATFPFLLVNHLSLVEVRLWKKEATWGELYIERHLAECFSNWPQLPWVKDKMACDLQQGNGKCGHNFSLNLELHWTSHTFVWGERKRVTNIVLLLLRLQYKSHCIRRHAELLWEICLYYKTCNTILWKTRL